MTMSLFFKSSLFLFCAGILLPAYADMLSDSKTIQNQTNNASASSQQKIDGSAAAAIALRAEIEQLQQETDNLTVYRDHLASLVTSQEDELASLQQQISEIGQTRQGIVPLMYQMLDGLEATIIQDKPLRLAARQARLAKLRALMPRADVSDAEKYRRILEAYQIEMDYGSKLGVYQQRIQLSEGDSITAEILYLGRVSLLARNLSASQYWSWDQQQRQWQALDSSENANIDTAYQLARQQIAPTLLTLPVSLINAEAE